MGLAEQHWWRSPALTHFPLQREIGLWATHVKLLPEYEALATIGISG
jgi:hypothetical protein